MPILTERGTYLWTTLILLFLSITFSKDLALIYAIAVILDYILFKDYPSRQITLNAVPGNSGRALAIGGVAYVAFMVIAIVTMIVLQFGAVQKSPTEAFLRSQWQAGANPLNPIFQDNPIFILISYGLLIPIIETRLTGRLFSIMLDSFGVNVSNFRGHGWWKWWAIVIIISVGAVFFHLQAKGITDNVALVLTFVFWVAQCLTIAYSKELESAIDLHIINNSVTVMKNVLHWF